MPNPWCTSELFKSWVKWPDAWDIDYEEEKESDEVDSFRKPKNLMRQSFVRARRAHSRVRYAIKCNRLPNLKVIHIKCVDCESRATDYDHRDYTRPLEVEPVCRRCNAKRGAAAFTRKEPVFEELIESKPKTRLRIQAVQVDKIEDRVSEWLLLINRKPSKNLVSRIEYEIRKKENRGKPFGESE